MVTKTELEAVIKEENVAYVQRAIFDDMMCEGPEIKSLVHKV